MFLHERVESRRAVFQRDAFTPEAHDARRAREGHEHDADARVTRLVQVCVGFDARPREVHVPEGCGGEDAVVVAAFGGDVDVTGAGERGGAAGRCESLRESSNRVKGGNLHPEHLLLYDPWS